MRRGLTPGPVNACNAWVLILIMHRAGLPTCHRHWSSGRTAKNRHELTPLEGNRTSLGNPIVTLTADFSAEPCPSPPGRSP